jgi:uncharacterized protein (DUF433 family)
MTSKTLDKTIPEKLSSVALTHHERTEERIQWPDFQIFVRRYQAAEDIPWARSVIASSMSWMRIVQWSVECALAGSLLMHECVTADPEIRGGRLVLMDTGFTVAQTLAELADSSGVEEVAEDFNLSADTIRKLLNGLSLLSERSWAKRP